MPKYVVTAERLNVLTVTVDAENEDEAMTRAYEMAPGMCAHCTGTGSKHSVDEGEWDNYEARELEDD